MKIGILTFHDVFNPGAFLQALSTQLTLQDMGHDAYIIDYTNPDHKFNPLKDLLLHPLRTARHPLYWGESIFRDRAFRKSHYLLNKTQYIPNRSVLSQIHFDAVIIGADIVWDYQSERLGRDPAYFGHCLNTNRLIAYAPSCGGIDITQKIPSFVTDGLRKFSSLSARDSKTAQLVESVTGKKASIIRDPALGLNLSKLGIKDNKSGVAVVYAFEACLDAKFKQEIIEYCKSHNLRTRAICYRQSWTDENAICITPIEWLKQIASAECVFTATFHGTVFSILNEKRFVTQLWSETKSKSENLLSSLQLNDRIWTNENDINLILSRSWDIDNVKKRIALLNSCALQYLTEALTTSRS